MAIKVLGEEEDIHVTAEELARYQHEYEQAYMMYVGKPPTLEQFIKMKRKHLKEGIEGPRGLLQESWAY
jgi:hypothetical protein